MKVLIESTQRFEKELDDLSKNAKTATIQKINDCAILFLARKSSVYRKLRHLPLPLALNGYESSLYILKVARELRVILTVDEDPIFGKVIFTLFRVVKPDELARSYRDIAESLYREILQSAR